MIRLLGHDYNIEFDRHAMAGRHEFGSLHTIEQKIVIDPGAVKSQQEETLIHEIIEAVNNIYELDLEHPKISTLSASLFAIFKDNPEVFTLTLPEGDGE